MNQFRAVVGEIRQLTHDVRSIELCLVEPKEIEFKAGQFVSFEIPKPGMPYPLTRPYSIASPPQQRDRILLVLNLVPGGPGSEYLFGLRTGDRTVFKGPAGSFVLRDDTNKDRLLIATGTGIAPFLSMIPAHLASASPRSLTLYWGLRSHRDVYRQDELREWSRQDARFVSTTTLSRPDPAGEGIQGRVTALVDQQVTSVAQLAVYVCGSSAMITDVTTRLQAKGLCPIYREKYY